MKKVIEGSLYNTETAKELASIEPMGGNYNDFNYFRETLYRTRSGKYFLHGEGHGNSRYGKWVGNTGGWGEIIRPYTPEEAREWAEKSLDGDEYIEVFGEPDEASDTKVPLNISVTEDFKSRMNRLKEETGQSISELIENIVTEAVSEKEELINKIDKMIDDKALKTGKMGTETVSVEVELTSEERETFRNIDKYDAENYGWNFDENVLYINYSEEI